MNVYLPGWSRRRKALSIGIDLPDFRSGESLQLRPTKSWISPQGFLNASRNLASKMVPPGFLSDVKCLMQVRMHGIRLTHIRTYQKMNHCVGGWLGLESHCVGIHRLDDNCRGLSLRPGHVVVFILPSTATEKEPLLEIGMLMSVWKGIKDPKVVATDCHVNSCMAFRAITLQMEDEDRIFTLINEKPSAQTTPNHSNKKSRSHV